MENLPNNQFKICTKCKCEKSLDEFSKKKSSSDGLYYCCKQCRNLIEKERRQKPDSNHKEISRKSYAKHKEKRLKEKAEYRKLNSKVLAEKQAIYYMENRESSINYQKQYIKQNKEKIAERHKEYRENNKEKIKKIKKEYAIKNKEEITIKQKEYYEKNREYFSEYRKEYYEKNKEEIAKKQSEYGKTEKGRIVSRNKDHRRRAITKQGDVTTEQLIQLKNNSKNCYWCGCSLKGVKTEYDHYMPLSLGGEHTISNIVISCQPCNNKKKDKLPEEFAISIGKLL